MVSVNVHNCIRYYQTAEEIGAVLLRDYCSQLISSHWVRSYMHDVNDRYVEVIIGVVAAVPLSAGWGPHGQLGLTFT